MHFDPFVVCEASMGSLCLGMRLKKSWLGDWPSSRAIFLQAAMAMGMFSLAQIHLNMRYFMFFTAASARPLDSGLYADASLCLILFPAQYSAKSPQNCGPPSVLM